jgi:hypothetical protein
VRGLPAKRGACVRTWDHFRHSIADPPPRAYLLRRCSSREIGDLHKFALLGMGDSRGSRPVRVRDGAAEQLQFDFHGIGESARNAERCKPTLLHGSSDGAEESERKRSAALGTVVAGQRLKRDCGTAELRNCGSLHGFYPPLALEPALQHGPAPPTLNGKRCAPSRGRTATSPFSRGLPWRGG